MPTFWCALALVFTLAVHNEIIVAESKDIGVCYGMNGDNLPSIADTIALYNKYQIEKMRLFEPIPDVLEALRGQKITVSLGIRNQDTQNLASSPEAALNFFNTYVAPYMPDVNFQYIVVGNEMIPGEYSQYIEPTMRNFEKILDDQNLRGIRVTTVVHIGGILGISYPPSGGTFSDEARPIMAGILKFLSETSSPLMINVYPYFAYAADPVNIPLAYAQFTSTSAVVVDNGLSYFNLHDAMVDAFFSAMEKEGVSDVDVVVSESGWPSSGNGEFTTPELAATYNKNFMEHSLMKTGTPKRPKVYIEGFIFAMFDENLKPAGVEQHFGLFNPTTKEPIYPVF